MSKPVMTHPPIKRLTQREMLEKSALVAGRVDQRGHTGACRVSSDEVTAMVCLLVNFGLVPVPPGTEMPEVLLVSGEDRLGPAS